MVMPVPSRENEKLSILVGVWNGEEHNYPSANNLKGNDAFGRVTNRIALEGFAVIQDYEQENKGVVNFRGHGIFRWDNASEKVILYWFDSFGDPPSEFHGDWEGKALVLISENAGSYYRATFDFSLESHYTYKLEASTDGKFWIPAMDGQYTRLS